MKGKSIKIILINPERRIRIIQIIQEVMDLTEGMLFRSIKAISTMMFRSIEAISTAVPGVLYAMLQHLAEHCSQDTE
jgi:hypothetical protein